MIYMSVCTYVFLVSLDSGFGRLTCFNRCFMFNQLNVSRVSADDVL